VVKVASSSCSRTIASAGVLDSASEQLVPLPPLGGGQFRRLSGEMRIGEHKLHESHTLQLCTAYWLRVCSTCGSTAMKVPDN